MRKYQLIIGDDEVIMGYSSENPNGPQISFNIQQFSASQTVNAEITINNIAPYYYTMNQNLIGKQIQLYAGMESNPIMRAVGYSGEYGLISAGYISAIIPSWSGIDSSLTIIYFPQPINSTDASYLIDVRKGDDVRKIYQAAYKAITGNATNINLGNTPIISLTNYQQPIFNVSDIDLALQSQHGISLNQNKEGFHVSDLKGKTIELVPGDFVTQPSSLNLAEVAVTLQMRADIKLGDWIVLPKEVYVGITSLDNIRVQNTLSAFQNKNIFLLFSGTYKVNKIWQLGDLKNTDAQAWCTIIHGVRSIPA